MEKASIKYGKNEIEFFIKRKSVRNINLTVSPNMKVIVSANESVSLDYLKSFIKRKSKWIFDNLNYFEKYREIKIKKEYVSGETFKYLGRQYRLKVIESNLNMITFTQGKIILYVSNTDNLELKQKLVGIWYRYKAKTKFNKMLSTIFKAMKNFELVYPSIRLRSMKTRWGSCVKEKNEIILNSELIKASKYCIEYVILHELLHFIYENHTKEFYYNLAVLMPDWKNRKEILDNDISREL